MLELSLSFDKNSIMKKIVSLAILFVFVQNLAFSWGKTGHRVVGQVAFNHLSAKAKKNLNPILQHEHLGMVGNYMDFIRADKSNDHMTFWHYCSIPDGKTYEEAGIPEKGDVIQAITRIIAELKSKQFTEGTELENIKYLVHLIGDIHQPLHVGNGEDKGGNDVKVDFMWESSNLHRVWDSGMIDEQQLSYTEYTKWVDHVTSAQLEQWQSNDIMIWVNESKGFRTQVYDIPENKKLSYRYIYDNIATVNQRLLQAGVRLAGILNEIYGS